MRRGHIDALLKREGRRTSTLRRELRATMDTNVAVFPRRSLTKRLRRFASCGAVEARGGRRQGPDVQLEPLPRDSSSRTCSTSGGHGGGRVRGRSRRRACAARFRDPGRREVRSTRWLVHGEKPRFDYKQVTINTWKPVEKSIS